MSLTAQTGPFAKHRALIQKMEDLGIRESDLDEQFCRSSGRGGQNVQKTSSKVQLTHRPTGMVAVCQDERDQLKNRVAARWALCEALERKLREEAQQKSVEARKERLENAELPASVKRLREEEKRRFSARRQSRQRRFDYD